MPRTEAGLLLPGRVGASRRVPDRIARPEYVGRPAPAPYDGDDRYTAEEIERIRAAGRIAAQAVEEVATAIRPGVTTDHLDAVGHEFLVSHDAYPSALGYRGFPKSICTSVNEVICHGIPDDTELRDGDVVKIDITAFKDGMHGDLCAAFPVGEVAPDTADLIDRTREALARGIRSVAPGREINVIGRTIESYAQRFGYGVVRDYTGHGVGDTFHTGLVIPHYDAAPDHAEPIEPGMVFTIEPMLTLGTPDDPGTVDWYEWDDGWTVVTRDARVSVQFEHTIAVTERGSEILTLP